MDESLLQMVDRIVEEHLQRYLQDLELEHERLQEEEYVQEEKCLEDEEHQKQERNLSASRDIAEPDSDPTLAPHPNSAQLQLIVNSENEQEHLLRTPIPEPAPESVHTCSPNLHPHHAPLPPVARDSINLIKEAKNALDHNDLASFHALITVARIMDRHAHPNGEENFYWILVTAGDRMSEGHVKLAKRMIDDFCENPYIDI